MRERSLPRRCARRSASPWESCWSGPRSWGHPRSYGGQTPGQEASECPGGEIEDQDGAKQHRGRAVGDLGHEVAEPFRVVLPDENGKRRGRTERAPRGAWVAEVEVREIVVGRGRHAGREKEHRGLAEHPPRGQDDARDDA